MGAGLGVMIGTKSVKDTLDGDYLSQAKSNIGSEQGKVSIQAGDTVHVTSSDIVADTGIAISGQDVTLDAKTNETHEVQTHEEKSSGLTLSLGGVVGNTINTVSQQVSKAKHRDDKRLTALELLETGKTLKTDVYEPLMDGSVGNKLITDGAMKHQIADNTNFFSKDIKKDMLNQADQTTDKALEKKENQKRFKDNLVQINVSLGSQKSKQVFENNTVEYVGGTLASNGTIDIEAKSAVDTKGSIKAIAETIKGKAVNLSATKDVSLAAAENTYDSQYTNTSSGWSVGTSISPVSGMSPNVNVGINKAKEDGNTHQTSHTGTKVVGTESVTIQSGQDTNITGSQVQGETVRAKVGKDLNITSLQDVNDYTSNTKTAGLNLSLAPHMAPILSGSLGRQTIDSQYKSVIEQAGIYAGDSGLSAAVGNTTQLRGAIIDAKGSSHLKTKNLDVQDIQNEATYHTSGRNSGFSSSLKDLPKAALQTIPSMAIPVQGQADSVTRSAIAESVIIEAEHSNRETISSDTQRALNQLKPIFDKKSVEERMELTTIIARNGAKLIGDIAAKKAWDAQVKALQETDPVKRAKYEREVKQWSDGGVNKIALHSVLGGFVSSLAGGTISTGALSAGANEALQGQLGKIKDPNIHRLASAMIGRVVTQSAIGGAIAENATKHNWLDHYDQMALLHVLRTQEGDQLAASIGYFYALNEAVGIRQGRAVEINIDDSIDSSFDDYRSSFNIGDLQSALGAWGTSSFSQALSGFVNLKGWNIDTQNAFYSSYLYWKDRIDDEYLSNHYIQWGGTLDSRADAFIKNVNASHAGYRVTPFVYPSVGDQLVVEKGSPTFIDVNTGKTMTRYNGLDYETQAVSIPTYDRNHFGDFLAYENDATVYNGELDGWTTNYVLFYGKAYSTSHPVTVDGSYYMKRGDEITYNYSRDEYYSGGVLIQNQDDIPEETRIALRDRAIQTDPVALEDQITQGQGRMAIGTAELLKSITGVKNVGNLTSGIVKDGANYTVKSIKALPDHVQVAYDKYQKFGWKGVLPEYENGSKGGGKYLNSNNILPLQTKAGADIKYREFDVNSISNTRDRERFIVGSDGSIYYTNDHYRTFVKIKGE